MEFDRIIFGRIKNVTDKESYTSSFELPENYDYSTKIKIEAPYHELTNGGHETLVYTDEIENAIKLMHENEIGYGKIIRINNKK